MFSSIFVSLILLVSHTHSYLSEPASDQVESWTPETCPPECACALRKTSSLPTPTPLGNTRLKVVDCEGQGLTRVPPILPADTQALLLGRNRIRSLADVRLMHKELLVLDLSDNLIRSLGRHSAFEGAFNLRVIDLGDNHLRHLGNNVFQGLFNLEFLDLSRNRISAMTDAAFAGLGRLESLRLSGNKLTFVQPSWWKPIAATLFDLSLDHNYLSLLPSASFSGLARLSSLDLSFNKLFRLHPDVFGTDSIAARLESLDLSSNSLTTVPVSALRSLRQTLKTINLSSNPIRMISTGDFSGFAALKDISVTHMPRLREVTSEALSNLPELVVLALHDNPALSYIHPSAISNAPGLVLLQLHNNNLTTLESRMVVTERLPQLSRISFYGNPIVCDCNIKWIVALLAPANADNKHTWNINSDRLVFQDSDRLVCDGPADQRFKLLTSFVPRADPTHADSDIPDFCAPRIVSIFSSDAAEGSTVPSADATDNEAIPTVTQTRFGGSIRLNCRAVGVPPPLMAWRIPNGNVYTEGDGTLVLSGLGSEHEGRYTCFAQNSLGSADSASLTVGVSKLRVQLFPSVVGHDKASLVWNGTDRERYVFQILYRPLGNGGDTKGQRPHSADLTSSDVPESFHYAGTVTPIMRSFTLTGLSPSHQYEACISATVAAAESTEQRLPSSPVIVHISCIKFQTQSVVGHRAGETSMLHHIVSEDTPADGFLLEYGESADPKSRGAALGIFLSGIAVIFIILGLSFVVALQRRQRSSRNRAKQHRTYFVGNLKSAHDHYYGVRANSRDAATYDASSSHLGADVPLSAGLSLPATPRVRVNNYNGAHQGVVPSKCPKNNNTNSNYHDVDDYCVSSYDNDNFAASNNSLAAAVASSNANAPNYFSFNFTEESLMYLEHESPASPDHRSDAVSDVSMPRLENFIPTAQDNVYSPLTPKHFN